MKSSNTWPIIIVATLLITVLVNVAFAWVAITDSTGGFEPVAGSSQDSSYKIKRPLQGSENTNPN